MTPNFPEGTGRRRRSRRGSALPTCPSSAPGSGRGRGGRSRGSDPGGRSPSGSDRPAPAAWPRASRGHPSCTHRAHISSSTRTTSLFLLSQTSSNPGIKNLCVSSRSRISVSEKNWFTKNSLISVCGGMRREYLSPYHLELIQTTLLLY